MKNNVKLLLSDNKAHKEFDDFMLSDKESITLNAHGKLYHIRKVRAYQKPKVSIEELLKNK